MRSVRVVGLVAGFLLPLSPAPARAQLGALETKDLRLIYFDPALAFVAPTPPAASTTRSASSASSSPTRPRRG